MWVILFFMLCIFLLILSVSLIILGEWISDKLPNSKFSKWWKNNIVSEVDDRFNI